METTTIIKQAVEAIKQGNKSSARTLLEGVIQNEPNNEEALLLLAYVAQTKGEAQTYLEKVININPNNDRAKQQLQKLHAMASTATDNRPVAPPAKTKESKAVLYTMLGGIIFLMVALILLLAGMLYMNANQQRASATASASSSGIPKSLH